MQIPLCEEVTVFDPPLFTEEKNYLLEKNIARVSDISDLSSSLWYSKALITFNWET